MEHTIEIIQEFVKEGPRAVLDQFKLFVRDLMLGKDLNDRIEGLIDFGDHCGVDIDADDAIEAFAALDDLQRTGLNAMCRKLLAASASNQRTVYGQCASIINTLFGVATTQCKTIPNPAAPTTVLRPRPNSKATVVVGPFSTIAEAESFAALAKLSRSHEVSSLKDEDDTPMEPREALAIAGVDAPVDNPDKGAGGGGASGEGQDTPNAAGTGDANADARPAAAAGS